VSAGRDDISAVAIQTDVVAPEPLFIAILHLYYSLSPTHVQTATGSVRLCCNFRRRPADNVKES
jgi:hypothetical protein